jgi:hypothetical protein
VNQDTDLEDCLGDFAEGQATLGEEST